MQKENPVIKNYILSPEKYILKASALTVQACHSAECTRTDRQVYSLQSGERIYESVIVLAGRER